MPNTQLITVENLTNVVGKQTITHTISLSLQKKEILGLIGPSGAGKTTIIKSIMGMELPTTGSISILGEKIPNRQIMANVGYMGQSDALYETLSARENMQFIGQMMGLSSKKITERTLELITLLSLSADLDKKVKAYSGGMKRRLSLALALIQNPEILILDEPTVGIDPILRASIWQELTAIKQQGKGILITTHVMDEAEACDRLLLIREGKIIAQGTPTELKSAYKVTSIEKVFIKVGSEEHA